MEVQVQRLVQSHGASQVRQWADEGMTVDTMGKPRDMRQFRDRQDERPAEVPKDIERRNAKSVQRSRGAHHEASKAGDAQVPDSVRDVISSPGQQLDTSIQRAMEERMGDNLGDVRIHTGPSAAKACEDINARAFTVGNHIAFNHGEYDPSSAEGQHVLAHELAHVRQQTGGAVSMLPQKGELEIDPDERLEREAEETAQRVMRGGKIGVHRMQHSEVHIQRMSQGKVFEAIALFEDELGQDDISEHRQRHNEHQFGYLYGVAKDVIKKKDNQNALNIKEEVQRSAEPNKVAEELAQRYDSIADLRSQVKDLKNSIDANLDDVALTDDQRLRLSGGGETDKWDNVSWTVVKTILSATAVPQLLEVVNVGKEVSSSAAVTATDVSTQSAGYDINDRAKQTIAQARRGKITSFDDIKNIWKKTNGSLEERAEQIEREIREGTWLKDATRGLSESMMNGE
ncbi:transposase [Haloferax larsenii JCM 13917]|nr:transposase [Haloferax larsenii JCM 13917]